MTKIELEKGQLFQFYNLEFVIDELLGYGGYGQVHKIKMGNIETALKSFLIKNITTLRPNRGTDHILGMELRSYNSIEFWDRLLIVLDKIKLILIIRC